MNGKTLIQISMIFLIILISLFLYLKYFNESSKIQEKIKLLKKLIITKILLQLILIILIMSPQTIEGTNIK